MFTDSNLSAEKPSPLTKEAKSFEFLAPLNEKPNLDKKEVIIINDDISFAHRMMKKVNVRGDAEEKEDTNEFGDVEWIADEFGNENPSFSPRNKSLIRDHEISEESHVEIMENASLEAVKQKQIELTSIARNAHLFERPSNSNNTSFDALLESLNEKKHISIDSSLETEKETSFSPRKQTIVQIGSEKERNVDAVDVDNHDDRVESNEGAALVSKRINEAQNFDEEGKEAEDEVPLMNVVDDPIEIDSSESESLSPDAEIDDDQEKNDEDDYRINDSPPRAPIKSVGQQEADVSALPPSIHPFFVGDAGVDAARCSFIR